MTRSRAREPQFLEIFGAKEHNLQVGHLRVPKNAMVVFTGVSGSGKSSLAFDTIYAEGQRRYVETLSAYARQFLGQLDRPHVDSIRGLSPTVAIEQKSSTGNPRSTVGTITEIYDYLRVLYARAGVQRCIECNQPVHARTADEIAKDLLAYPEGTMVRVLAPLVIHRKGEHRELFVEAKARGFLRIDVNGESYSLDDPPTLKKHEKHTIDLVIDRIVVKKSDRARIAEAVAVGLREGKGELKFAVREKEAKGERIVPVSASRACHGKSYPELSPQHFSFNSPLGMCVACNGLGTRQEVDPRLVVPDVSLSIRKGAIAPWAAAMQRGDGWTFRIAAAGAKSAKVSLDAPWGSLTKKNQKDILYGTGAKISVGFGKEGQSFQGTYGTTFEGVIPNLERLFRETSSEAARESYRKYFRELPCDACGGRRLSQESLHVFVGNRSIADVTHLSVLDAKAHFASLKLSASDAKICEGALREINARLGFLLNVGLEYLTLDRGGPTLSGGEAQRIRLASQLGSELSGVMYVLDEPSIGLHPRDNARLIDTLLHLRDLGNTVIVVEHDEDTIRASDHVVDFGVGAGHLGGNVVYTGDPRKIGASRKSLTGAYLSGKKEIAIPKARRKATGKLTIKGARENNLKNVSVDFPLGVFTAVTGVSGAGKSSLISSILLPALAHELHDSNEPVGEHDSIAGAESIARVISIDQQPIGRTPRSNPGTYTKAFDAIREIFAQLPEARARGYDAGRFSFNVKGGRCEACSGDGVVKVEMHFLADVYIECEVCRGKRYNEETLDIRYKGKNITDVLAMSVDECLEFFRVHKQLARILETLVDVGLGYMKVGQPAPTLSGGEAQRVKLSREIGKSLGAKTLYVLDEPTTGLHFEDIQKLLAVLQRLVDAGSSVVVIEHNLDVIKCADWVIDLGPEGGEKGGRVIAVGTPEAVARDLKSSTGRFLKPHLKR